MKRTILISFILMTLNTFGFELGEKVPGFKLVSHEGKRVQLDDLRGKPFVLEWLNHDCPFVKKHYKSGNMQKTQKLAKENGYTWISIISSAPGKQGYVDIKEAKKARESKGSKADFVLLDSSGVIGREYQAKTTPYIVIANKKHELMYALSLIHI